MQDSEQERDRLASDIGELENQKKTLENENLRVVAENRELLNQLEDLNNNICDSDAQIKSLTSSLTSAQYEIRRLNTLAARALHLEAELQTLESDQARLRKDLDTSQEEERSALSRWRQAECKVRDLSDQIERIEKEAIEEREKHVELLGRMERRRAVEKELETAAGRLKGAAVATSLAQNKSGTNVVSHFVRDLLLDNSNLQAGITELREMLRASNEEVENLRDQILLHQPMILEDYNPVTRLNEELDRTRTGSISQELHVHHHYHNSQAKSTPRRERVMFPRRPKKRSLPSLITPPQRAKPLRPPLSQLSSYSTPPSAIDEESPSSLAAAPVASNRWSFQSSSTAPTTVISSIPSSPQSWRRNSSIFDRIEEGFDSSRPTSPESFGIVSPLFGKSHQRGGSEFPFGSETDVSIVNATGTILEPRDDLNSSKPKKHAIGCCSAGVESRSQLNTDEFIEHRIASPGSIRDDATHLKPPSKLVHAFSETNKHYQPSIRRTSSSDTVCSVSGMDIHTITKRPSLATFNPLSSGSTQGVAMLSSEQATSAPISVSAKSSQIILSDLSRARHPHETSGLGRWMRGKWGIAPMLSTGNLRGRATVMEEVRAPGINQKGFIAGLRPPGRTPNAVVVKRVNEGLLKETLGE